MTVILLGLVATLSAVIIVTVVATITQTADNQSENINFPQSPHYNAPLTGQWPQSTMYSFNLSRVSIE